MAEDVLVTYKVGESIYQIPASNQEKLLEKYPDAERMSTFNYGGEDYYIPNQNAEKFISKYPDAEPMDNDANIFMQSYRGKQNRGIPTITVTEGEENGLTSTLAESEDVSQKPKASNGDIATPQPVNDTFFKEDAATQQQNIAKDKKDRAIAEQIYNTFESKPELFKTVEAREKFYDLLASKGYANAFSIGESMVSGDSRFDQRDEKESYIPNAGIDYVIGRRRHDDIVNTPVMRDPAVQLKLHTTFTNAGEGLQQTINTLNAGGDNEQQRSMAKDFSLLQTRLSSIQKAEKEGRINTQGAKDAIKNLSDAAANIRKKYKNYIDGVTEEGEQKKTFEEKITGESIEGKKDFAGISLDTKPTQQKVKGLSKDAREKVLSTLDDIESLYKKFSSVSAQSNAAYVNRPENQYQLATALSEMGKFKESNKILGELLNKNAASYQIYQAAAYNYYQLGDNAAARSMQIAAQQRQPISDIPSNEGGDTTGLDMGLGNPANPQYGNQGSPTPASEEMGLIAGALRHYTPLYSNAANISEGWMHALEKLKKGGIDYSKLQQAKNFGDVVKLGVGEGARIALNTIAGFAEGLFAYSMNTTPVGLAFVEGTQGLTAEGVKATIGKVGAETFNYFMGLKGSDKVTPDEAVAAIMSPVTTVLQGKEMRGAEIPEWAKDVGLIADVIAMHLFMGAVSRLRGTEEAKTAQDILDGKEVTVEHANNLIYSIIKMTNEEGGVIYKIQHEYAEKLKELEKTVADFPETREVLQPEIEATNKKLEDIQGTLLHHDILTESSRVEIQGKEKALSALKDAIEKQKEGSAAKPLLEERARQLQEEIDGLEAERVQKTKDAVDAHARESFAKLADEVLDIRFGDYVDYGGIKGRVERRPDGVVVVTTDGKEVLVEGGFSGKRLKDLGLKKIEEPKGGEPKGGEPKTEPQPETEVEQGVAEVKAPDVKFNFEENTVTVDGKKYTYDGVGVDKDGNTTSIRVIDENGNVRHLRNEEVVFEIELQKETAELGMIEKSEVEAAAKELNIKEQKNEKETRGTPEKQQGVVEKLQPAEQAKAVEENKGEQKQEQLKTQDDAVQEQKTKGVDVRQQAADGEAVGERNAKGQEITDKGEAEKIKKQIAEENAKSEWQKEQEAIDNDSSLSEEEKEKKKIESTAKALDKVDATFTADLSDSNLDINSKKQSAKKQTIDNEITNNAVYQLIEKAIEKVEGISVNNIFDLAKRIAKLGKKPILVEHIVEAIQYEVGRVENEKDAFSLSIEDAKDVLLNWSKDAEPANKTRMDEIGIVGKTYRDRINKLKVAKNQYEKLNEQGKALVKSFLNRYNDTIIEDAKLNTDEYLQILLDITKSNELVDVAENIQKSVQKIDDKEAIQLSKLPPIKEPLKNRENTQEALRRFSSEQLSKIPLYDRKSIVRLIGDQIKKSKQVTLNVLPILYNLPNKVATLRLNSNGEVDLLDANDKKISGKKISKEEFINIAVDIGNSQRKDAYTISEAYHKAKADGSNPELVKAVEDLLGNVQQNEAFSVNKQPSEKQNVSLTNVEATAKALEGVGKEKGKNVFEIGKKIYDTIFSDLDTKENEIRAFLNIDEKQRDKQLQLEKGKLDKLQRQYDRKQLITENDINALEKQKEKVELIDGLLKSQKVSISDIDNQLAKYALDKYPNIFTKKETYPFYTAKGYDNVKNEIIAEAYHKAKADGSNPELVKAVEELIGKPKEAKSEQKAEKPAIEKTLVEEHGVAKEDAAIVTSVLDKLNKGLQSMGVSFDITKGLQLGKGKEGSEASAHAQFRIDKGKRIVEILKSDLPAKEKATAVLHEVGHLSLHELLQQHIDGSTPEIKKALDTMIKAFNESGRSGEAKKRLGGDVTIEKLIEEHNAFKEQGEKINAASTEALSDNIPNFRDFHEFITDSLNKYLKDGTAGFGKEFDAVLQKIKELLVHVYDTVRGGTLEGLTVSPELKQVFDRMLGKDVDLFKEPEKPQAKPLGEVKVDMPTTDEQGRVMSLSEALRMAKEQGQIKGKETGGLKHSEGMSEADFVAMYQKQQQDNLRAELLGAEDVDVAHTAGEERISQRQRKWKAVTVKEAKKIIEGLDPKYESTNAESVNSLVDRIFAPFQDYIKAGVDVFDVASEYAKSIYPKDRTEPYAAQKAAVATVLMTKAANELRMGFRFADSAAAGSERGVFKRGTLEYDIAAESLKKFEDYLSGDKRVDATALAFANSHINPNEVYALLDAIDNSRKKVMGEKAKSGRTKEEVAKEMRTLKPTAEEVDTAAEKATAKTTKVKPKRSLFSGSTTKKTRSTISVERKKSAKDKLKSGLSKIQAAIPSAKPTPKKGGLTEEPPLPKGVVEGVKDIAEAAISEGHYTQEAIKDYVAEKTKGILDRATSDGIIDKAWDGEIKQKSGAARADEVSYAIVKALKTGKGDAITKQLGEALLMQDAEYDPSSKTKRQQATARLAEILKDPAAAEARLNAAINMVVNQSIVNPKMLDYLGLDPVDFLASKENPHGMTMEQFEAFSRDMLKKKLYDMAQDFMGHGVHEQRVLPLPKKRIKPSASEVKKFIKDFYDNPEMTDSMLETALTDHFDITPEQATAIASKVRGELADIVASRSQKKIDALAEEISDGDRTKKKRVTDMVVKALTTNGAFGDIPFSEKMAAALSNRSVAPADINKILAYGRMANATDSSLLKAFYMRKAATILSKYDMSAASFLFQGLYEQGVVNILGNPRTSILTASLSMLKTMPFDVVRMFVTRPSTFVRAVRFSKLIGSKGIGSVTGEGFRAILNGVETVRNRAEIETKPQIRRESANKQARLTSWRYLRKASLSGNDPKRAQLFILKALQSLTFSGGSLRQNIGGKTYEFSPTHWLVNLISGLDVVVKAGLMNLHNYYNAERFIRESGIKFGTSEFTKKMSEMLTTDPLIFDAIDKQVNMEVADAMKNGIPLPKDYVHERKTQLYQEYVDKDVVSQSLFEINKSALIGIPRTWLGAHTYNFIRSNTEIKDNEKTVNAAVKYFFGSALYFSRVGINVIERRGRGIPFYNMFLAAAPYEFTIDASGKVVRRTTESGKVIRRVENKRDFAFGILQATTTTALAVMLINNIFQQEDLKDEKGNPVIDPATGEPVKHWVLNPSSPIRFHGRKKALTTTEKNAVPAMCIELTNVEDPDKRFWKFEWFPESWYPMLFMLGEESDDIRYKEEKLQVGGTEKDNSMLRSVQEEPTSMFRIVATAGIGAFNASFTTSAQTADEASRLISQDKKRDAAATIAYRLTGQPFITTVNPRLAGQIADAYDYFKEREKTYVKLSIENTNIRSAVSNMAQYSMNQVWAGRYLVNNEDNKYTIYDAHGQPMEREPGDLLFLPAMFSEDMYYGWAEHIYKSPLYKIYMDDNGNFDESVIAIPNRIGWNDKVSVSDMVKQQVRQKTREYYGQLVTKFYGKLLSTPYEERGEFIKELWKAAVNEAKTEYGAKEKTVEGAVGVMQRKNMTDGNAKEE